MSFKAATVDNGGTTTGYDPAPFIPTGTLVGDRLTAIISTTDNAPSIAPTTPTGWTLEASGSMPVDGTASVSPVAVWIYGRDATSQDVTDIGTGPYTWTFGGAEEQWGVMILTDPAEFGEFAKNEQTNLRTDIDAPTITTTVTDELVFHCVNKDNGVAFTSFPTGTDLSEADLILGATNGAGGAHRAVHAEFAIGATGVKNFTMPEDEAQGYTFSLRPLGGETATGSPSITAITAAGTAEVINTATGTPSITPITAAGAAFIWPRVYLNTTQDLGGATELVVTDASADGTSITFDDPAGAPTGSLFLGVENQVDGLVGWIAVTVDEDLFPATGAPSITAITAAGTAEVVKTATGSPSISALTSAGTAEVIQTAVGGPTISNVISAGIALRCTEILAPDTIAAQTNLAGVVTDIDEQVGAPDANWLVLD